MGQGWWTGMLLFFVTSLLQFGRLVMIAHLSSWCEHVDFAAAVCAPRETCAVEGMGITTVEAFLTASKIKWCQKFKRREGDASSRAQVRSGKLQFQGESSVTLEWPNGPKGILKSYAGWPSSWRTYFGRLRSLYLNAIGSVGARCTSECSACLLGVRSFFRFIARSFRGHMSCQPHVLTTSEAQWTDKKSVSLSVSGPPTLLFA